MNSYDILIEKLEKEMQEFRASYESKSPMEVYGDFNKIAFWEEYYSLFTSDYLSNDNDTHIVNWLSEIENPMQFLYDQWLDADIAFDHDRDIMSDWLESLYDDVEGWELFYTEQEIERENAYELALDLDRFAYEYDTYEYMDKVENREEAVENLTNVILLGYVKEIKDYLHEFDEYEDIINPLISRLERFDEVQKTGKELLPEAILVERDYKGTYERYALTPEEFKNEYPDTYEKLFITGESNTDTIGPMVHIYFEPCVVGDDAWNTFFTDMTWGLPESDIASGNHAYIREDFMQSLKKHITETSIESKPTFSIYQMKNSQDYKFMGLDYLRRNSVEPNISMYDKVYTAELNGKSLDDIYMELNIHHPQDFIGHSLSVSDVIAITQSNETVSAFYVDSIGFTELPELAQELQQEAIKEKEAWLFAKEVGKLVYDIDPAKMSSEDEYDLRQIQEDILTNNIEYIKIHLNVISHENKESGQRSIKATQLMQQLDYFNEIILNDLKQKTELLICGRESATEVAVFLTQEDAQAHMELDKLRAQDVKATHRIAIGTVKNLEALSAFLAQHPNVTDIVCCMDNSDTAEEHAKALVKCFGDEYSVSVELPAGDSWTAELDNVQPAQPKVIEQSYEMEL